MCPHTHRCPHTATGTHTDMRVYSCALEPFPKPKSLLEDLEKWFMEKEWK